MKNDWQALIRLVGNQNFHIEKVRMVDSGIAIEGDFDPPPLTTLPMDDQVFAAAFLASHGSLKKMESLFGISYPTVKNRLNRIAERLGNDIVLVEETKSSPKAKEVLDKLDKGELSFDDAMEALK